MKGQSSTALLVVAVVSIAAVSSIFITAEAGDAQSAEKKPAAPQYSESCAHGHNGFDCKESSLRADINDLKERVKILEKRTSTP